MAAEHAAKLLLTGAGCGSVVVVVVDADSTTVVVGDSVMQSAGVLTLTMPMSARGRTAKTEARWVDERIVETMRTPKRSMNSAATSSARSLPVPGSSQTTLLFTGTSLARKTKCNQSLLASPKIDLDINYRCSNVLLSDAQRRQSCHQMGNQLARFSRVQRSMMILEYLFCQGRSAIAGDTFRR